MIKKLDREFILYATIGLSGVLLDVLVFFVLFNIVGLDKVLATFISISLAITNNFLLNVFFNFKTKDQLLKRYLRFYLVGLSGIILTALIFFIFVDLVKLGANLVKIGSLLPVLLLQYSLNKHWSFRKGALSDESKET